MYVDKKLSGVNAVQDAIATESSVSRAKTKRWSSTLQTRGDEIVAAFALITKQHYSQKRRIRTCSTTCSKPLSGGGSVRASGHRRIREPILWQSITGLALRRVETRSSHGLAGTGWR